MQPVRLPLTGINVLEVAGGAAGAYCARLLVDAGASVELCRSSREEADRGLLRGLDPAEVLFADFLNAGKRPSSLAPDFKAHAADVKAHTADLKANAADLESLQAACRRVDIVIIGEDSSVTAEQLDPRVATVSLSWFGKRGEYSHWRGSDLIVQALTGLPHMVGPVDGPPLYFGDRQSTLLAGVTAYIAVLAGLMAKPSGSLPRARRFEVNILESCMVLSEMHMHFFERDGVAMSREGLNRFSPNGPVGIYPCKVGWVGITCTTPEQWKSMCVALQMHEQSADEKLLTRELRFARLDEVEAAMCCALAERSASEWAELGRRYKVPMVVVPDAEGMLAHPIFNVRKAFATFASGGTDYRVPRTPFSLTGTPIAERLDGHESSPLIKSDASRVRESIVRESLTGEVLAGELLASEAHSGDAPLAPEDDLEPPLTGLSVVDFTMGWAGPLATRLLADLGADVLKIEAGRYPDWWRGVNWTPDFIAERQYENAKPFLGLNRGKSGASIDLTTEAGRAIALSLVAGADLVIENQAAGVMSKMGLGYQQLVKTNPELVMVSMSAFGIGNAWSDTRAYGSTLEQGSGLPGFVGSSGTPPTMLHLAYGDPVGGVFGCAAALTALWHRKQCGQGQFVNLSMVETMLPFTTPSLLRYQINKEAPPRLGNRHALFAPHGIFPAAGKDRWIAIFAENTADFDRLARAIGRPDWIGSADFSSLPARQQRQDEIDAAISNWSRKQAPEQAAIALQSVGVPCAPVLHCEELAHNGHLQEAGFFIDLVRVFSGPQRQAGIAIIQDGRRLGARRPAPLLGEHSWPVLSSRTAMTLERFDALVRDGVISFAPTAVRNATAAN